LEKKNARTEELEKCNRELAGESSRADELDKMVESYRRINKEPLAEAEKVDAAAHKVAEEHAWVLKEMDGLRI